MPAALSLSRLRHRFTALTPRERLFLMAGAAAVLIFLLYMVLPDTEEPGVELAATAPVPAAVTAPAPLAPPVATAPAPSVSMAPPADMSGITLRGVMGGGPRGGAAIMTIQGAERVIRVGREIVPGMTLREIGVRHAVATTGSGDVRFDLGKGGGVALPSAPTQVASPAASESAGQGARHQTMQYRLGLQPVKSGGRISGFVIKPGANLPQFSRAGLQAGDVILSVNGQAMQSEEDVGDLHEEISTSVIAEFEFLRGGKRMSAKLPVNPR